MTREVALRFERWEWNDAEVRLGLMEEAARMALRDGGRLNMRIVVPVEEPTAPPILLPGRFGSLLYGPDGRQLETS